ncbi:MAG: 50S ribosomal protein L35 [Candidatus Dojkabacteria bacterium]
MKNKIKTHKATAKRFKLTAKGRVRHNKQGDNAHLKAHKSRAQKKRKKGKTDLGSANQARKIKKLLGK